MASSYDIAQTSRNTLAKDGWTDYTGTDARTGTWCAIKVMADTTVFSAFAGHRITPDLTISYSKGDVIEGLITGFTLTSGKVRAYNLE